MGNSFSHHSESYDRLESATGAAARECLPGTYGPHYGSSYRWVGAAPPGLSLCIDPVAAASFAEGSEIPGRRRSTHTLLNPHTSLALWDMPVPMPADGLDRATHRR